MHKLLVTFLVAFVGCSILAAIMQGGGGIASTVLTGNVTAEDTTLLVESTAAFAGQDIIRVGSEQMMYTSTTATTFVIYTRGYNDTKAESHSAGDRVYTLETSAINDALNFNMAVELETGGMLGIITLPVKFFTNTLPHLVVLNVNFLQSPELQFIGIFWFAFGLALLVTVAIQLAPIAVSLLSGLVGIVRR